MTQNAIGEAIAQILLVTFFGESKIQLPKCLLKTSADPDLIPPNIKDKKTAEFHLSFESFSQTIRDGNLGKTPQYWRLYLEMMRSQHMIHLVV